MERAKLLLSDPTSENLRYAALELRMCMEALTYEKLRSFATMIPKEVLETWQPPQAVKALLEFEPEADQSFTIRIGREKEPGIPAAQMQFVGHHSSLRRKWLSKHYNKLGKLLHAPSASSSSPDSEKLVDYLTEVVADLEEPLRSTIFGGSIREVLHFTCSECGNPVVCNSRTVAASHKAICLNPQCKAEYYASIQADGETSFQLMTTPFECSDTSCTGVISIENRKLDVGVEFKCPVCGIKHVIVCREWGYEPKES